MRKQDVPIKSQIVSMLVGGESRLSFCWVLVLWVHLEEFVWVSCGWPWGLGP